MAIAYFDCPMGIAGDMCLGALIDAGMPLSHLVAALKQLPIANEFDLVLETVQRQGQRATKLWVKLRQPVAPSGQVGPSRDPTSEQGHGHDSHHLHQASPHGPSRRLPEIVHLIEQANLSPRVTTRSLSVFDRLAQAEAKVHGIPPEQVHFHEVGAVDAIVDIVGTCIALDWFDIERLHCSALPTGGGTVTAAHGRLPVPVPAVLQLYQQRQVPVYSNGIERELVTPTGAALVTTLATGFGPPPAMTLERVGLGAGTADLAIPNVLRVWIGAENTLPTAPPAPGLETFGLRETITVLETQVDDLSPQVIGYLFEQLLTAGALDVFTQAIGMKKSRPGTLISVICHPEQVQGCEKILFEETTTLGVRRRDQERTIMQRTTEPVDTLYGPIRIKVARPAAHQSVINVQPEYEDCAALARETGVPLRTIYNQALHSWKMANPESTG
ncbi:MAG: nickel pincer cofactor biosynthesis protein LarC [Elainellaceae cyanobacterium]